MLQPTSKRIGSNDQSRKPTKFLAVADRNQDVFDCQSSPHEPEAVRVDLATFSELLISKRDLKRSDSPGSNQLGLYDSGSGVRYVINEADLYLATT